MTRVLLVKTSSMGDVIHTLPAITDACAAVPGIVFDWVVEEAFAEIPAWHPRVERVIPVAVRRWRKNLFKFFGSDEWARFRGQLGQYPYDLVIDAQGLIKSAVLTRYSKAPVAGLDRDSAREPLACRFYDRLYAVPREQHALERTRQLFAQALGYELPQQIGVDDVALDEEVAVGVGGRDIAQAEGVAGVGKLVQIDDPALKTALRQQKTDEVRSDETASTCNQ